MIQVPNNDSVLQKHLESLETDRTTVFLLDHKQIRGSLIHCTEMINNMRRNHQLGILETLTLGHAYIAAGLLSSTLKGKDRIAVSIECGGPIKGITVEAWATGEVRGYLQQVPIPIEEPMKDFDLSPFFGPGFLTVTKFPEGSTKPFSGQIMLEYGSIAKDLATYFTVSEQTPSLFFLSIKFDREGKVIGAGGLFLQALPGAEDYRLERIEQAACSMPSLGQWFAEGRSSGDLIDKVFGDYLPQVLDTRSSSFYCPCSVDRFTSFLQALTGENRTDIKEHGPFPLELVCHNCGTTYSFTRDEIQKILL